MIYNLQNLRVGMDLVLPSNHWISSLASQMMVKIYTGALHKEAISAFACVFRETTTTTTKLYNLTLLTQIKSK